MFLEEVHENEVIIHEGDKGSQMYISASGVYTVLIKNRKGITFRDHRVFGELAILYKAKRMATIKALTSGKVWVIHRHVYQKIIVDNAKKHEDELRSFLNNVPNVNNLSEENLKIMTQILKTEFFAPDAVIVQEGDVGDKFYIIHAGNVTVTKEMVGKVADLERGSFFGEKALLQSDRRQATVTAKEPGVECLTLTRNQFLEYFDYSDFEVKSKTPTVGFEIIPENKDYQNLEIDQFIKIKTLGVGGFGRVELIQHNTRKDQIFALKYLKKVDVVQQEQVSHAYNEKDIQIKCNSMFIVQLYRTFKDNKYLYFLMEPCMGGDLWTLLQREKSRCLKEPAAKFYSACVTEAFSYLHERSCVFRDLKPENLLIDKTGYLKLTDFGFAKSIGTRKTYTFAGTPEYVAPEIIYNRGHDKAVDYWALGIFIFELIVGQTPFKSSDPSHMKTYQLILRGLGFVSFPKNMSDPARDIVKKLCKPLPADRLGCLKNGTNDIRKHKWFDGFEWDRLRSKKIKPPHIPKLSSDLDTKYFDGLRPDNDIPPDEIGVWDSQF